MRAGAPLSGRQTQAIALVEKEVFSSPMAKSADLPVMPFMVESTQPP